nr:hypothetical protein [Tanacetum cinerariifolium]
TSSSQPQEVHNSGYDLEENVVSYDAYLAEADLINETPFIPPVEEVVAPLPDQHSESLTDLQFNERFAMLYGKLEDCQQANLDLIETKDSLTSQLESCKLDLKNLEWNKILKDKITNLVSEKDKIISDKKACEEKYLEETVSLQYANRVMSDLLKTYRQPTHTIPMLNKRPMLGINDLHKTALGRKNPKPSSVALDSHPALYDANVLFTPSDDKLIIWETEESKALAAEGRAIMLGKPGTVKPVKSTSLNMSYFVSQKELSCKQ